MQAETRQLLDLLSTYRTRSISQAVALPPTAYASQELYELERERIFEREWLCIGREEQIASPGDYFTLEVLDEPMVIVRGRDGEVRALSTICRHRYMPVVEGRGNLRKFTCPYHLWTYRLDGSLGGAPYMDRSEALDRDCGLPRFRLESWQGFLFVNLDPDAAPLAPRLAGVSERIAAFQLADWPVGAHYDQVWQGNWKLAAENGMESYHHMGLHADNVEPWMPAAGTYFEQADAHWNLHRTPIDHAATRERGMDFETGSSALDDDTRAAMLVFFIYPSFVFVLLPNNTTWLSFLPLGPERIRVIAGMDVPKELADTQGKLLQPALEYLNAQDSAATEKLQSVMCSRHAVPGALSDKEESILHFYRYLASRLGYAS